MQPNRRVSSRPDLMRSQMTRVPYGPGPYSHPTAPHYPEYNSRDHRPTHGHYPPSLPNLTRQHHSYYDERAPPPPPPMHMRHPNREEIMYDYNSRSSIATTASSASAGPYPPHHHQHHHLEQHHHQPYHPQHHQHQHQHHHFQTHHQQQYHHHPPPFSSGPSPSSLHGPRAQNVAMMAPTDSTQQPTYRGHIKTTKDAILLLSACDLPDEAGSQRKGGIIPPRRVTRRLLDSERAELICSGSTFVWDEKEAGMRRWTDGKCWSASRVSGCFLTYRELEARKKPSSSITGGPTSNLYKADGLIKQSFSITTTSGRKLHAISYYTKRDVREGLLRRVSEDPRFVGEGGGEWDLKVDEHEYLDPVSRAGDLPDATGVEAGSQSPTSMAGRPDRGDRASSLADDREVAEVAGALSPRTQALDRKPVASPPPSVPQGLDQGRGGPAWQDGTTVAVDSPPKAAGAGSLHRSPYTQDATPLHEARSLFPIHPIPVHSRLSDGPVKPVSRRSFDGSPGSLEHTVVQIYDEKPHGRLFRSKMSNWNKAEGLKRSYADYAAADEQAAAAVANNAQAQRPRLQRMRSSSMTNGTGEDAYASVRTLARAGADEDGISKMRSTHIWSPGPTLVPAVGAREQDSAVGALLSLRSSASDISGKMPGLDSMMNPSPSTTTPTGTDTSSSNDSASKPSLSRSDRAALDRFSIRI